MFLVDDFNEDGSYKGGRIDCPRTWSDFHEKTPSYEIVRAHLKISNRGLDVIDAVPLPLCCAMGKTDDDSKAVGIADFDFTEKYTYVDTYDYSDEEREWMDSFGVTNEPLKSNPIFPIDTLRHGEKTAFGDITPETSLFDNTPLAKPIKNAVKYATICKSEGEDPSSFLREFEKWWNLEEGIMDSVDIPQITELSYPRVAGSSSKNSSPIYGFDNYAGHVEIKHTGLTRSSFLTDMEESKGVIAVADFGRFNAFMRYVIPLSDCLPGRSRDVVRSGKIHSKWAISPEYAFKYRKGDFVLKLPKSSLPIVDTGPAAKPIIEFLMSEEYCKMLIKSYAKVDMDDDYTVASIDIKKQLYALRRRIKVDDSKPYVFKINDVEPVFEIQGKYIPNLRIKGDISSSIIDTIGSKSGATEVIGAAIGAAINIISNSPKEYTEIEEDEIMLCNCIAETVSEGSKIALNVKIKEDEESLTRLLHTRGVNELFKRNTFCNIIHYACSVNYIGVVKKVFTIRDQMSNIAAKAIVTSPVKIEVAEVKGVDQALKAWGGYYLGKCWKLTDRDKDMDKRRIVLYSSLARILTNAKYNAKTKVITWPDISVELIRKGTNLAKKNRLKFSAPDPTKEPAVVGELLDQMLTPDVSFKDLALNLLANLEEFEYDIKSRKNDYTPVDLDLLPKLYKPIKQATPGNIITPVLTKEIYDLIEEQREKTIKYETIIENRDVYDIINERIHSLFLDVASAYEYLSSLVKVTVVDVKTLRATKFNVTPDDISNAAAKGLIKSQEPDFSNLQFDDDEEEEIDDDIVSDDN